MAQRNTYSIKQGNKLSSFNINIQAFAARAPTMATGIQIQCQQLSKKNIFQTNVLLSINEQQMVVKNESKAIKQFIFQELGQLSRINICFPSENQLKTTFKQQYKKMVTTRNLHNFEQTKQAPKNNLDLFEGLDREDTLYKSNMQLNNDRLDAASQEKFEISIQHLIQKQPDVKKFNVKTYHLLKVTFAELKRLNDFVAKNIKVNKFVHISQEIISKIRQCDKQPRHNTVRSHAPSVNSSRIDLTSLSSITKQKIIGFNKDLQHSGEQINKDCELISIDADKENNDFVLEVPSIRGNQGGKYNDDDDDDDDEDAPEVPGEDSDQHQQQQSSPELLLKKQEFSQRSDRFLQQSSYRSNNADIQLSQTNGPSQIATHFNQRKTHKLLIPPSVGASQIQQKRSKTSKFRQLSIGSSGNQNLNNNSSRQQYQMSDRNQFQQELLFTTPRFSRDSQKRKNSRISSSNMQFSLSQAAINYYWKEAVLQSQQRNILNQQNLVPGMRLLSAYQDFRKLVELKVIDYIERNNKVFNQDGQALQQKIVTGKFRKDMPPRFRMKFVRSDQAINSRKRSKSKKLWGSFQALKLLNESLLSSQIVRMRKKHISTVLIRGPFAVLFQYKGVCCLVVELLTCDQGIGYSALSRKYQKKSDRKQDSNYLIRVNSGCITKLMQSRSKGEENKNAIRYQSYGIQKKLNYDENGVNLDLLQRQGRKQEQGQEPIVILNNDDLIRQQLSQLSPLLNIQNLSCNLSQKEGQNIDMSMDLPLSTNEKQRKQFLQQSGNNEKQKNILPLTLKLQVFPECSTDILGERKRENQTDQEKKLRQQSRNYKDQLLFYLMVEEETFLPNQQNNLNSQAINLSTLLTTRNSLKTNLGIDQQFIKVSIQKHNSQKKEHKEISAQIQQFHDNCKNFSHKQQDFKGLIYGISQGVYAPIDGEELHQLIRSFGYGIRHLGKIYKQLQAHRGPKFMLTLIGAQLYARVIKSRIHEQCLCNRMKYEAIIIENINEYFNNSQQSARRFESIKQKVNERYGTQLKLFDQISFRLLILQRSLQLLNIKINDLKFKQIKFNELIIKKNFMHQQYGIESIPKVKAYEFSSLPIIHFSKESSLWNGNLRGIKSILTLIKAEVKRLGYLRPYFRILIAECAIGCGRFDLAEKWLKENKGDVQNSPSQMYFLLTLMKAAFSQQDIISGKKKFNECQEVIDLFWKGHHPVIITVNELLSKYFSKIFEGIPNSQDISLRPLFSALIFSQDIYGINSLHSVSIMFRINKLQVESLRLRKFINIQNAQFQSFEQIRRGKRKSQNQEDEIYSQLREITVSLQMISQICEKQQNCRKANFLLCKSEILISICKLEIGQRQEMDNAIKRLQRAYEYLESERKYNENEKKNQLGEINQKKYLKNQIKCSYIRFLSLLKQCKEKVAKKQAEKVFLLLIEEELKQNSDNIKDKQSVTQIQQNPIQDVKESSRQNNMQKKYIINYSYKLKERFMLAALCLSLKLNCRKLKEFEKIQFGLGEQNCLGNAIMSDQFFFFKFAFNYQTIKRGCRNTLERIFRKAASQSFGKGLNLIDFIWKEHIHRIDKKEKDIHRIDEKVLELMKIFKVQSI